MSKIKVIRREGFYDTLVKNLSTSEDSSRLLPTLDRCTRAFKQLRFDTRELHCNKDGEPCVLALMANHVYYFHNKDFIDTVNNSWEYITEEEYNNNHHNRFITELDVDDKRIFVIPS